MAAQQEEQQQSRSAGKVLWFSDQKGFGFIRPDNGGEDLFVHQSAIKSDGYRSLAEGESVEFIVSQGNGGKTQAVDVTSVGGYPKKDRRGGSWRGGNDRRNGNGGCYNCGSLNHLARDCTKNFSDYNNNDNYNTRSSCYNCGETGHFASECRRDSGGSGGGGGGAGKCFNCGKFGHFAKDCSRNSGRSNGNRFVCGGFGHMKKDCTSSRGSTCYNCGETGHLAKECTKTSA